jgi:two-component system, OmpR family, sensor histidine kinase BaeS
MRTRLFVSFFLIVLVSVGSFVFIMAHSARREVGAFMLRGGMVSVHRLAGSLEDYYRENGSWDGVEEVLAFQGVVPGRRGGQGMASGMMHQRLRLADRYGEVLFDTQERSTSGALSRDEISRSIPIRSGLRQVGYLLPEGGVSFSAVDQINLLDRLNSAAWTAGFLGAGLSLLLAVLLTYPLLKPVHNLRRAAEGMAQGDFSKRVPLAGDKEIATLGKAFNNMAENLQQAEANRKALTADIAHELRTPLAVQRAHLEAIQDNVYPLDLESLEPILAQNVLLTRLVEDLRTLALAEAGQLSLDKKSVDLSSLAAEVVDLFTPAAGVSQISLSLTQPEEPLPVLELDPARIEQIISNLVSNAIRFTPPGGAISLTLSQGPGQVILTISDTGPGIPDHAMPYVFERFYRADVSRSREKGGSGLGLAIARKLAQAHGGELSASNRPEGGAVFTLRLPKESRTGGRTAGR